MDAATGAPLDGRAHLRQSVRDVLTTRIGTRVMRREYGSRIPELVDAPLNDGLRLQVVSAAIEALGRWEPRLSIRRITVRPASAPGRLVADIEGDHLPDGRPVELAGVTL